MSEIKVNHDADVTDMIEYFIHGFMLSDDRTPEQLANISNDPWHKDAHDIWWMAELLDPLHDDDYVAGTIQRAYNRREENIALRGELENGLDGHARAEQEAVIEQLQLALSATNAQYQRAQDEVDFLQKVASRLIDFIQDTASREIALLKFLKQEKTVREFYIFKE